MATEKIRVSQVGKFSFKADDGREFYFSKFGQNTFTIEQQGEILGGMKAGDEIDVDFYAAKTGGKLYINAIGGAAPAAATATATATAEVPPAVSDVSFAGTSATTPEPPYASGIEDVKVPAETAKAKLATAKSPAVPSVPAGEPTKAKPMNKDDYWEQKSNIDIEKMKVDIRSRAIAHANALVNDSEPKDIPLVERIYKVLQVARVLHGAIDGGFDGAIETLGKKVREVRTKKNGSDGGVPGM